MNADITYKKTHRGERALIKKLPEAMGKVLSVVGKNSSETEIFNQLENMSRHEFKGAITWLLEGGFIRLIEAKPLPFLGAIPAIIKATQVEKISIDEFASMESSGDTETAEITLKKDIEYPSKTATLSNTVNSVKLNVSYKGAADLKVKAETEKEQERLAAIETAKLATQAKAKEAEIQAQQKAAAAEAEREQKERWAQVKAQAKAAAEEETRLKRLAETEVQRHREKSNKSISKAVKNGWYKLVNTIKLVLAFTTITVCLLLLAAHFINIFNW